MKKILLIILGLLALSAAAGDRQSADPANYAMGARSIGMGATVVAVGDDANALQANPAVLGSVPKMQVGLSSYQLLNEYKYFNVVSIVPTPYGHLGVTFLNYGVTDIPETSAYLEGDDLRIYKTGSYDYAEKVLGVSYAVNGPRKMAMLKNIDIGVSGKMAYSTLADETLSGFGLDAGLRFEMTFPAIPFVGEIGDVAFGLAIQNLLPPSFASSDEDAGSASVYQMNLRLGAAKAFSLFEQNFILAGDMDNNGMHVGLEYIADRSLRFRAGLDNGNSTLGLGYRLFSFSGFDGNPWTMSLDYAYRAFPEPLGNTHYVSVTLLGVTKTKTPAIISSFESARVTSAAVALQGTAEAEADVILYVNQRLRKTVKAGPNGIWSVEGVFLDNGQNDIYAVARYEQNVESDASALLTLYTDQVTPTVLTEITSDGAELQIRARVNKPVSAVATRLPDESRIVLQKTDADPLEWRGVWQIAPEYANTYVTLRTIAVDDFGNRSAVVEDLYSTRFVSAPRDRTVTAEKTIYVRGTARRGTARIAVGAQSVAPDPETGRYELAVDVPQEGKNVLEIAMIDADEQAVTTSLRVLKVKEAYDLQGFVMAKNQITALLTLGFMDPDKTDETKFRPAEYITRAEFAKVLALVGGLTPAASAGAATDVARDNPYLPYIGAVLSAGYLTTLPEGGFQPNAFMTRKDAIVAIVKMDGLDTGRIDARQIFADVPAYMPYAPQIAAAVNVGIITPQENFYPDRELTRGDAAAMLGASLKVREKTNELYDWKRGYGEQFEDSPLNALPAADRALLSDIYVNGRLVAFEDTDTANLKVLAPRDRDIYDRDLIEVKGLLKTGDQVTINGVAVPVQKGAFLAQLRLHTGRNVVRVEGGAEASVLRVLYVPAFTDKPDTLDNLKYNVSRVYLSDSRRFDGVQLITRGEIMRILSGIKGQSSDETSTENITFSEAVRLLNEWDGKLAEAQSVAAGVTDPERPLNRDEFITMLANTDTYQKLLDSYRDFDSYGEDEALTPVNIEDRSTILIQAEDLTAAASGKKKITDEDFQTFLRKYDRQRLNTASTITRTGDSIAADGRTRLLVIVPENNFRTSEAALTLRGFSGGEADVRVNNRRVAAASDSSFEQRINLEPGKNTIVVENTRSTVRLTGLRLLTYSDIQNIQEKSLIEHLATIGYFKESAEFFPNKDITREEAAAMFVRMLNVTPQQVYQEVFRDVPANRWSAASIKLLVDRGVIKDQNNFRPEEAITQQEAYAWFRQLSRAQVRVEAANGRLPRRTIVRWLFADERVRQEIDKLNQ